MSEKNEMNNKPNENLCDLYRDIFENIDLGITLFDKDFNILFRNSAQGKLFNGNIKSEDKKFCFMEFKSVKKACKNCPGRETMKFNRVVKREYELNINGESHWALVGTYPVRNNEGKAVGYVETVEDISIIKKRFLKNEKLVEQLTKSNRMDHFLNFAGDLAHDFNNILNAIMGNSELIKMDMEDDKVDYDNVEELLKAANRAKELINHIVDFSKLQKQRKDIIDIKKIIEKNYKLLKSSIPSKISVYQKFNLSNSYVLADSSDLLQILMNLSLNAVNNMKNKGDRLDVLVDNIKIDDEYVERYPGLVKNSNYIFIKLTDNSGTFYKRPVNKYEGSDSQIKEDLVDSNFLIINRLLSKNRGFVFIEGEEGKGTVYKVFFPQMENPEVEKENNFDIDYGNGELVLLVDDEEMVIKSTERVLTKIGYTVKSTTNPFEAIDIFNNEKVSLLFTDQMMPLKKGTELAEEIKSINPLIPIVLCSGYSDLFNGAEKVENKNIDVFVKKPINISEISKIIKNLLEK